MSAAEKSAPWYADGERVAAFARHMVEDEGMEMSNLLYMLEKPWKWTAEYESWNERGAREPSAVEEAARRGAR
jgi:hypothetical protein